MNNEPLKIVRVIDILLIPKYLVEQVKDVYWSPDELYGIWPTIEDHPGNLLYAMVDKDHQIKGFIWGSVVLIGRFLFVNVVSLDREYQNRGVGRNVIMPFLHELKDKLGLSRVIAATSRPKAMADYGWRTSKHLMEV